MEHSGIRPALDYGWIKSHKTPKGNFLSRQPINEYRAKLDRINQISVSRRESVVREPFKDLLKRWGKVRVDKRVFLTVMLCNDHLSP